MHTGYFHIGPLPSYQAKRNTHPPTRAHQHLHLPLRTDPAPLVAPTGLPSSRDCWPIPWHVCYLARRHDGGWTEREWREQGEGKGQGERAGVGGDEVSGTGIPRRGLLGVCVSLCPLIECLLCTVEHNASKGEGERREADIARERRDNGWRDADPQTARFQHAGMWGSTQSCKTATRWSLHYE